jgi:hypothetical protein
MQPTSMSSSLGDDNIEIVKKFNGRWDKKLNQCIFQAKVAGFTVAAINNLVDKAIIEKGGA